MWVSPQLLKFRFILSGQVANFLGFLTRDPSVIWNTVPLLHAPIFLIKLTQVETTRLKKVF